MKNIKKRLFGNMTAILLFILTIQVVNSQQVEVQGELKVTQMTADNTEDNLVTRNTDGTLGTRSVSSLPAPPPAIDTTRNLASDFELAKQLCQCQNLPPFMIQRLLDSGYTQEDLIASGVPIQNILDAQRIGILLDPRDNQVYKTVTIGTQTWMAENLNYGNIISGFEDQTNNSIIEKYCYDDSAVNCDTYGGLYQWDEMMQYVTTEGVQGVCPTGWHLPTDAEWQILEVELGITPMDAATVGNRGTDQGSKLAGSEFLWTFGGLMTANAAFGASGFTALPGGTILVPGDFNSLGSTYLTWTSSQNGTGAWYRAISNSNSTVFRDDLIKELGFSVRCVKD